MEQGREVMAAPGSPLDPRTKGCNRLIRDGAALIENAQDVIDVLENTPPNRLLEGGRDYDGPAFDYKAAQADIDRARAAIKNLLSPTPTFRDEIIRQSGFPVPIAAAALMELELCGEIYVEADGRASLSFEP